MYLKSLELNGFKSFAKKTTLEFGTSIVGIVGPNGSGKSNAAESFRFVLGEQSMKSLRGKRGEDLIYNGSKTLPKMNRASVKVIFDNSRKIFNIDFDEVSLERIVYRDGENEYLLNGSKVRLKDIVELLASANIGASGHHIISQGEADRMLNSSLKDRKAMIEDALGLKVYQYKKQESERKLEKTDENIKQVEALRKEVQPHLKFLEKQMEKVERAKTLRDELTLLYREYLKREEVYIAEVTLRLKTAREVPEKELKEADERIEKLRASLSESEENKNRSDLISAQKNLREAEEKRESIRTELSKLDGMLFVQEKALTRVKPITPGDAPISLSEIENASKRWQEFLEKAKGEENLGTIRSLIGEALSALRNFIESKRTHTAQDDGMEELKSDIARLKKEKAEHEHSLKEAESKERDAKNRYHEISVKIEEEQKEGRQAERDLFALMNRRNELSQTLMSLRAEADAVRREEELFKNELNEAQALAGLAAIRYSDFVVSTETDSRHMQEERRRKLEKLKVRLEEIGGGGAEIAKEFEEVKTRDEFLVREIADLEKSAETLKQLIIELSLKLDTQFKEGVLKINTEFQKLFVLMFGGGTASLSVIKASPRRKAKSDLLGDGEMTDEDMEEEDTEEGIDISISLPNKRVKGLEMLSGGERALTSIALLFAISQVNPPPFIILDETDAALDEANSKKYGDMVENLSKHSQLILITHNRETMSHAGILYGVTMGAEGCSKLLSVKFDEAVAVAK